VQVNDDDGLSRKCFQLVKILKYAAQCNLLAPMMIVGIESGTECKHFSCILASWHSGILVPFAPGRQSLIKVKMR